MCTCTCEACSLLTNVTVLSYKSKHIFFVIFFFFIFYYILIHILCTYVMYVCTHTCTVARCTVQLHLESYIIISLTKY